MNGGAKNRRAGGLLLLSVLFAGLPAGAATLQKQVEAAVEAFAEGDYPAAYWAFEAMEVDFGMEPEFRKPVFQRAILPVRGYAALMTDRPTDALVCFQSILTEHDPAPALRAFILYNAALAQSRCGTPAVAARTFRSFRLSWPGTNEAALALLQEVELYHEMGKTVTAMRLLGDFYASEAPATLRMQGRLRALQIAVESGDPGASRELLFETPWAVERMPDIAVLSFAAIEVGDLLLAEGRYADAIRAYRHALPLHVLTEKQAARLREVEARLGKERPYASRIWTSHATQLVDRLRSQLAHLRTMPDYTPGLYLRFGQAFLLAARFREAVLLFSEIAGDEGFEPGIRAEAHYRWTVALCEGERWEAARECAHEFLKRYPEHQLANDALFLVAHAYQGEGRYGKAIEVLDELIARSPGSRQRARWQFTRGYNRCVLEAYALARDDFAYVTEQLPEHRLAAKCALWHGLTRFFERDYESALRELRQVRTDNRGRPLEAEAIYRIANVRYALRDYDGALEETAALIDAFPGHHRIPESRALRGDSLMGLGELIEAAAAFREVPPDAERIYDYAVFQTAKIYHALERHDLLREHLRAYVAREDAATRHRVSEAIYRIGRSFLDEGRPDEAFPVFEDALERFGDDPGARAVGSILEAYADLRRRTGESKEGLEAWLNTRMNESLHEGRLTWFARLSRFAATRRPEKNGQSRADATLLSVHRLVPIGKQDAACLAAVGLALARRDYRSADPYFEAILNDYGDRPERAAAFYGKALLASADDRLETARRWLRRFLEETPTDPLAADARLLAADVLARQGRLEAAKDTLNEILRIKALRGRPYARALAALARIETEAGNLRRAIPYWQRIYTLYRAYPENVAEAYWESARLFETIGDLPAARNTLIEMLADPRLERFPQHTLAQDRLPELEALLQPAELAAQTPAPDLP